MTADDLVIYDRAHAIAAAVAGASDEMDVVAEEVRDHLRDKADQHAKTGRFRDSIQTTRDRYRSVEDRVVYTDHPGAWAIENGARGRPGRHYFTDLARRGLT